MQGIGQLALDGLQDALAFHVAIFALVEITGRSVIFLEKLPIDFHRLAGRLLVPCKQRANHHHRRAKTDRLGNVAMATDAAVGNDGFGSNAGAPFDGAKLPAPGAESGLEPGDTNLAWTNAHFCCIGSPVFKVDHCFRCAHVSCNHETFRKHFLDICNHVLDTVGMAMRNVDGDIGRRQFFCGQCIHSGAIRGLNAQRNAGKKPQAMHVAYKSQVIQVKAMHDIKIAMPGQPLANGLIHHRFHVCRHHRNAETAGAKFHAGIALTAAFDMAFARQEQDIVVVEYLHVNGSNSV